MQVAHRHPAGIGRGQLRPHWRGDAKRDDQAGCPSNHEPGTTTNHPTTNHPTTNHPTTN
jgi:hypothetical protein